MGAFCVYGISKSSCKIAATKKQPVSITVPGPSKVGGKRLKSLTIQEFGALRDELAKAMFDEAVKSSKISPEFDAPPILRRLDFFRPRRG